MSLSTLDNLFLDALVSARDVIGSAEARNIWQDTVLTENADLTQLYAIRPVTVPFRATKFYVSIRPVSDLPAIEARECLLRLIVTLQVRINYITEGRRTQELCDALGCLDAKDVTVAERWRKLAILRAIHELPYIGIETRPHCKICGGIVATGAGWTPNEQPVQLSITAQATPALSAPSYRTDLHHSCKLYASEVMLPKLKAQRERAALAAAKEIDK